MLIAGMLLVVVGDDCRVILAYFVNAIHSYTKVA